MKKFATGLLLVSSLVLVACSNQDKTDSAKSSEPKVEKEVKKETDFHDFEHGKKYGEFAANFDKKHGYELNSDRHIGSAWEKDYTDGYLEGYNSVS